MKRAIRRALVAACFIPTACAGRNEMRPAAGGAAPSREEVPQAQPHVHEAPHELPATAGEGFTAADVRFMQNMIGHHAQALTMAAMAPDNGAGVQLLRLARKIDISQRDEIDFMKRWLAERNQAIPDDAHAHDMRMPGMLTPPQLAQLDAARGGDFERLFLSFMIQHHLGALEMVEGLFASPGAAQDSEIFRFITDVDADQRDEIFVMQSMLDMLDTASGSRSR
jgi:uncharacterized protein (DUF305 family)